MAASRSTTYPAPPSYRRQALIWLTMTLVLGVVTALIWMFSQTPAMAVKIENAPISAPQTLGTELKQPLSVEALHELDTDVQPLSFEETVRDLRSYPDEFKDKRYLLANKGKWTVQVMNVAENEVIVSYLEGREDRNKFSYFRYLDDDKQLRYMLTYGLMSSSQEAVGAAKLIDFRLPANVRVLPEEINRYVSIIDNYERPDPVKDLSTRRARSVNLNPTKREVPVRQKAKVAREDSARNTAKNNRANPADQEAIDNSSSTTESIRESEDNSDTLSVNEERTVATEAPVGSEQESKKPTGSENDNSVPKKPPVVPTPKPPSAANSPGNKNVNSGAAKNSKDGIKELIEERSN